MLFDTPSLFSEHSGSLKNREPFNLHAAFIIGLVANLFKASKQQLAIVEELIELQGEFNFHGVYIVYRETQEVADREGLTRELIVVMLILQFLIPEIVFRERVLIITERTVDVQVADIAPLTDFYINGIVERWQNVSHFALG